MREDVYAKWGIFIGVPIATFSLISFYLQQLYNLNKLAVIAFSSLIYTVAIIISLKTFKLKYELSPILVGALILIFTLLTIFTMTSITGLYLIPKEFLISILTITVISIAYNHFQQK